jgi:RNA polymerase sigma-70 factor (ECF subfamily)
MFLKGIGQRRRSESEGNARFEQVVLPHLDAAYNLARWLTRNDQDAQDVVQEATLRALTFFDGFHGGDGRAWLLAIVRTTCYTWLRRNRAHELTNVLDEEWQQSLPDERGVSPEAVLMQRADAQRVREALEQLPLTFREVIVLREMEDLSYREIADLTDVPVGTVMSRLARARKRLQQCLLAQAANEGVPCEL